MTPTKAISGVPSYLETPSTSDVDPPVETRDQKLPFHQLNWPDFEKLCLRLVRLDQRVEHTQQYGVGGQKQEGIDLYARHNDGETYSTYQCKREKEFNASKINDAVSLFLKGEWAAKSIEFVLCCMESFDDTKRAKEVERQHKILKEESIQFTTWDSVRLCEMLKNQPEIVDDFFGRVWVRRFCGKEKAKALDTRKRMDAVDVKAFRADLGKLYGFVFNNHDSGLPMLKGAANALPLEQRYVLPDVSVAVKWDASLPAEAEQRSSVPGRGNVSDKMGFSASATSSRSASPVNFNRPQYQRRSLESWLASTNRPIVLGDPGSGKSTLLRFVAIDLLSEAPLMGDLAARWGLYLPVWVPFGLWTKRLSESPTQDSSLEDFLCSWLHSLNEARLWPIVEKALQDDRLLLLVDGLDEWKDDVAAQTALGRLQVFVQRRETPVFLTSRPYGFEQIQSLLPEDLWPRGELAPWNEEQQKQLALIWFGQRAGSIDDDEPTAENTSRASLMAQEFMVELGSSTDLHELAQNPLLLSLLIAFKLHDTHLPSDRFKVYQRTIRYLVETHPAGRRAAASLGRNNLDLSADDIQSLFAFLAYQMQSQEQFVALEEKVAKREVETFLRDESVGRMGLQAGKAHQLAGSLLSIAEETTGLLTEKAPGAVGFFHRAFQEYLAAQHLSEMNFAAQAEIVRERCSHPQWHEVILCLFSQLDRPNEVAELLTLFQDKAHKGSEADRYNIKELLAKIACGPFSVPVRERRQIVSEMCRRIEFESWQPHRERLLNTLVDGLRVAALKDELQNQFQLWFPCFTERRGHLYWAMRRWPRTPEVIAQVEACLWRGLHDEITENARGAARTYAEIFANDDAAGQRLLQLACCATEPLTRAVALEALLKSWPNHPDRAATADRAHQSLHPELRFVAIKARVQQKKQTEEDREILFEFLTNENRLADAHEWQDDITATLLQGWPKSDLLKQACFSAFETYRFSFTARPLLSSILLQGFPNDDEVVAFYSKVPDDDEDADAKSLLSQLDLNEWDWLRQNFVDHPTLVQAVDALLEGENPLNVPELCYAALVGKTSIAKSKLIASLAGIENSEPQFGFFWSIRSLLDGWGMNDPEVKQLLKQASKSNAYVVSGFAHLLPRIILNKKQCRTRLLQLLRDPKSQNYDLILEGLKQLGDTQSDTEIVNVVLKSVYEKRDRSEWSHSKVTPWLLINSSQDERVKEIARQQLDNEVGYYVAVAHAFGDDEMIREGLLKTASPLPASLRQLIGRRLSSGTGDLAFDLELLENTHRDPDSEVKIIGAIGYAAGLASHSGDSAAQIEASVEKMRRGLRKGAPVDFALACASYAGLVTLDRWDVVEHFKAESEYFHLLVEPNRASPTFVQFILKHWEKHRIFFGPDLWHIHQMMRHDSDYNQQQFWEAVAPFVDAYPLARDQMLHFIQSKNGQIKETAILRFLARVHPISSLLRKSCFWNLERGSRGRTAGQILGSQFSGDLDVFNHLTQNHLPGNNEPTLKDYFEEGEVIAICQGWPHSTVLRQWHKRLMDLPWKSLEKHRNGRLDVAGAFFSVICCHGSSQVVQQSLQELLLNAHLLDQYGWTSPFIVRPLRRRIEIDSDLAQSFLILLQTTTSPSEKATLPELLQGIENISLLVEKWCRNELEVQLNVTPDVGFDLHSNRFRPLSHLLLDFLQGSQARE